MPNKKINELSVRTPSLNDLMIVGDPSTGYSYKATINALTAFVGGNIQFSTLGGISLTNPSNGQVLQFNGTNWVNATISVPVTSVFGRTGNVVATEGDYSLTQLGDVTLSTPSTNQVLQYNGTAWVNATLTDNGITSLNGLTAVSQTFATGTSGTDFAISSTTSTHTFNLPTASATNRGALSSADWSTFNAKQDAITLTTTGSSGSATLVGATLNIPTYTLAGLGGVSGSGTTNYLSKWTSSSALGNSQLFDNGTSVGVNTTTPSASYKLDVNGAGNFSGGVNVTGSGTLVNEFRSNGIIAIDMTPNLSDDYKFRTLVAVSGDVTQTAVNNISINSGGFFGFGGGGSEKMRLTAAGRLLIGTSTESTYELDVVGDIRSTLDANINGLTVGRGGGNLDGNTIIGSAALTATNTGGGNTAVGYQVFQSATTGYSNTAIGTQSLRVATSGYENTAVGRASLLALTSGNSNVAIGKDAGLNATTGASNTFIGTGTGAGITTGSFNTIIGAFVTGLSSSLSNTIILADGQGNQRLYINNTGQTGIGTTSISAGYRLEVAGSTIIGRSNATAILQIRPNNGYGGWIQITEDVQGDRWSFGVANNSGTLRFGTGSVASNTARVEFFSNGNVGIGVSGTDSGFRLDVNGTARVQNTATFSFKSTTLSDVTALFGDNLGVNTQTGRTKVVLGNTSGVSEFIVGQSSTNNLLFNWTYNATAANAYGVLETFAGNNPLVLQSAGAGRVGVGNTSPSYKVDITGDLRATTSAYFATTSGNVGIGTTSPTAGYKLDVNGSIYIRNFSTGGLFGGASNSEYIVLATAANAVSGVFQWTNTATYLRGGTSSDLSLGSNNTNDRIIIKSGGNVLIGTTTDAGYKLDVNGTARVQGNALFQFGSNNVQIGTTTFYGQGLSVVGGSGTTQMVHFTNGNASEVMTWQGNGTLSNSGSTYLATGSGKSVGVGTTSPNASALLDVSSTTKGFLPPRMTGAQAEAIATPAAGLMIYANNGNGTTITSTGWWGYDGTTWVKLN